MDVSRIRAHLAATSSPLAPASDPAAALADGDVPYGNDWQSREEVDAWSEEADRIRPWRAAIRAFLADQVASLPRGAHVLELGAGPGLLAECVLERCPDLARYTVLDFSVPMIALCRERLARFPAAAFAVASFKTPEWLAHAGGPLDSVLSMQAVHELRHKRHALPLYAQVRGALAPGGRILICDHLPFDDSEKSVALYMTEAEQLAALSAAAFGDARVALAIEGLRVYAGTVRP